MQFLTRAITLRSFEIYPSTIPNHSLSVSSHMQSLKKIGQKLLKLESGNQQNAFLTRAITLKVVFDEIYPSTIPNHSLSVSTHMQSLKKIGQKLLKLESGNKKCNF